MLYWPKMIFKRQIGAFKHPTFTSTPLELGDVTPIPIGLRRNILGALRFRCIKAASLDVFVSGEGALAIGCNDCKQNDLIEEA